MLSPIAVSGPSSVCAVALHLPSPIGRMTIGGFSSWLSMPARIYPYSSRLLDENQVSRHLGPRGESLPRNWQWQPPRVTVGFLKTTKEQFIDRLDAIHPRYGTTIRMAL